MLPAESYLDTGNRGFFANSDEPQVLHPDLSSETGQEARQAGSCAPLVDDPETVRTIWQILADRADNLGISRPVAATTNEPDIAVLANGRRLRPIRQPDRGSAMFCLPPGLATLRLLSRATAPCATRPWIEDRRTLGVAVSRIVMRDQETLREIPLDHPTLADGWWAVERDDAAMWRWTDGDAELPLPAASRACLLEIRIQCGGIYLLDAPAVHLRAAA